MRLGLGSFALLKDNELLVPMAFAFACPFSFVLNSMPWIHEMRKQHQAQALASRTQMYYCYVHRASRFSLLVKHRHGNNCSARAMFVPTSCTYNSSKPAQLESNTSTPSVTLVIVAKALLKSWETNKQAHFFLKIEWKQSQ